MTRSAQPSEPDPDRPGPRPKGAGDRRPGTPRSGRPEPKGRAEPSPRPRAKPAPGRPGKPGKAAKPEAGGAAEPAKPAASGRRPAQARTAAGSGDPPRDRRGRPNLTSRAAVLAIVVCAIALSVAYPLREYIAQRAEIAALAEEQARLREAIAALEERRDQLEDPVFTEREARNRLHYHYPGERSYVIVGGDDLAGSGADAAQADPDPWFSRLWQSVRAADRVPPAPDADSGERGAEEPAGTGTEGG